MQYVEHKGEKIEVKYGSLDLSNRGIYDISEVKELKNLKNLRELYLECNHISKIKGLENLTKLRVLYLNGNELTEIEGLESLKRLVVLKLSCNKIRELKGLENLQTLTKLFLHETNISQTLIDELGGLDERSLAREPKKFVEYCRRKKYIFKVNEYITLKLVNDITIIYIKDNPFRQCKFLLLEILVDDIEEFDKIESIDEVAEKLDDSLEPHNGRVNKIPPEAEFWGHCSNIQVWAEHDYDTYLLHRHMAFYLLEELTKAGDSMAQKVFKEEIAKRIEGGYLTVTIFLITEGFLKYLALEEFEALLINSKLNLEEYLLMKLKKGDKKSKSSIGDCFQGIGNFYYTFERFEKCLYFYRQALKIFETINDEEGILDILNNIGIVYIKQKLYLKSIKLFYYIIFEKPKYCCAYYNLACIFSLQKRLVPALTNLKKAIDLEPKVYKKQAMDDSDLDYIKDSKEFRKLVMR